MFDFLKKTPNRKLENIVTADFGPMVKIIFWNSTGFFFFIFLIPYITDQVLDASGILLGAVFSSQTFGALISVPIVGFLTDKYSKKRLVLLGSIGRGISYIILYIAINIESLLLFAIGTFVLGFAVGFFWPPFDALIAQKSYKENRSFAYGQRNANMGWGNFLGSIISFSVFALASHFTPENTLLIYSPLLIFTLSNFYGGYIFYKKVQEDLYFTYKHERNISSTDTNERMQYGRVFLFGAIFFLIALFFSAMNNSIGQPFLQSYLIEYIVEDPVIVMIIYFPSGVLAHLFGAKIGDIIDKMNDLLGIALTCGLGAITTWFLIQTRSPVMFSILLTLDSTFAIGFGLILRDFASRVSKLHRGKIFGLSSWFKRFGSLIGPLLGGIVFDQLNHSAPFIISIAIELALIPLYIIAIRKLRPYIAEKLDYEISAMRKLKKKHPTVEDT